jgi:hypothetical protein
MNDRAKRIHRARPLHSPEGGHALAGIRTGPRVALKATVGPEGLPSEQAHHAAQNADLRFAPSAALEPATSGLGVRQAPFGWCCHGASLSGNWSIRVLSWSGGEGCEVEAGEAGGVEEDVHGRDPPVLQREGGDREDVSVEQ